METTEVGNKENQRDLAFVVDQMLGELARWLRMLGYDTFYSKDLNDDELIEYSKMGNRVLVTCDHNLHARAVRKGIRTLLLRPSSLVNRLSILAKVYGIELKVDPEESRCPVCNGEIRKADDITKLIGRVPPRILDTHREFWICSMCKQVYWIGGHWKNIEKSIEEAKRLTG
jgi:hypothetical protein